VKKRKERRKAPAGKSKARKAAVARETVRSTEAKLTGGRVSRREQSPWQHGLTALGAVDWLAVAICVLPLVAMALIAQPWKARTPRHTDSSPVTELFIPQAALQASPWRGDLALEAMPVVQDAEDRMAVARAEPLPSPWHGDLAIEAMPVVQDARTQATNVPVIGGADVAAAPAQICLAALPGALSAATPSDPDAVSRPPAAFGWALAAVARAQLDDFVIYNPRYVALAYPRGDTLPLYGVCTDVVVRAYRAFGIDFQELIHTSRLGRGDPSIDHRRVEVVRKFLERHGTSFEISEFPENFLAGDIVTYQRPHGRVSQHHIAIVSERLAPSGRPMIVHNRGWGPQLEDALFADRITGHYRFSPADAEAFERSRLPRAVGWQRRATVSLANGR
jgi:uncharacterized protein YijF (DUF1287 family)